jgi:cytochrome c-type biogenesis protein CcmH
MTWIVAIALAIAAFAVAAFVFGIARSGWTAFAAALALGLAGYALQASPGLPGAPTATRAADPGELGWSLIEERKAMFAGGGRSANDRLIIADGFARRGRYADAATILRGAVTEHPRDAEAWLALANALVEHADGALTPPALLAYRRSAELDPTGVGPAFFLGFALIRQGQIAEARGLWASTLQTAASDAPGRAALEQSFVRLNDLIERSQAGQAAIPGQ